MSIGSGSPPGGVGSAGIPGMSGGASGIAGTSGTDSGMTYSAYIAPETFPGAAPSKLAFRGQQPSPAEAGFGARCAPQSTAPL